jgi:hypothetical protein
MADHTDAETLAREVGDLFGVAPVRGFRVETDELALPVARRKLSMVAVAESNYYLRLHFWGSVDYVLEIEGDGLLRRSSGETVAIAPRSGSYAEVIALIGQEATEAVASNRGGLRVAFSEGDELTVDEPDGYETWQLRDEASDYTLVTHAGGGIVQFGAPPVGSSQVTFTDAD